VLYEIISRLERYKNKYVDPAILSKYYVQFEQKDAEFSCENVGENKAYPPS